MMSGMRDTVLNLLSPNEIIINYSQAKGRIPLINDRLE